ncbi:MAG: LON peptidase substrate-binding domain-containing protein [Acidobacteriota bacterium]|nr:LON peptidase substrate-binding domain-containing protein [Acidobacteriota bacterium]
MFPSSLPIFPLPTVVLFPNVFLPLHIFEPRYRQMTADALAGDRLIGMVLLRPGNDADYEGRPPVYGTGCTGLITHAEKLDDGRFNLVLRGLEKFTILGEEDPAVGRLYRSAFITPIDETVPKADRDPLREARRKLEGLLEPLFEGTMESRLPQNMPDDDLINALAQYLDFDPMEKQALLERLGPLARCRSMIELLEMKALLKNSAGDAGLVH